MSKPNTTSKTNAVRLLDAAGVAYQLRAYDVDENDLSAETVAHKIGLPNAQVFKTLAARTDKNIVLLTLVPAGTELSLKALAANNGYKKCELLPLKDVLLVTGYVRGGVSPLGTKSKFPVFIDISLPAHDTVSVSAGLRGLQILLAPSDLIRVTDARLADLTV